MFQKGEIFERRYEVGDIIAKTGHSTLYFAKDIKEDGREVCLKAVHPGESVSAARRGAEIQANADHPNICKIMDYGFTEDGGFFVVQELFKGKDLEAILDEDGVFSEAAASQVGLDMLSALSYLHSLPNPVVYRDMKPSNIMKDENRYILVDFEIAREYGGWKGRDTKNLGTRGYAAPEQQSKEQTDARADIFALGMTLHALLTNKRPDEPPFTMHPVKKYRPGVTPTLSAVIEKATKLEPSDRFQTADAFREKLSSYTEEWGLLKAKKKKAKILKSLVGVAAAAILLFMAVLALDTYKDSLEENGYVVNLGDMTFAELRDVIVASLRDKDVSFISEDKIPLSSTPLPTGKRNNDPVIPVVEAPGTLSIIKEGFEIDYSNSDDAYIMARNSGDLAVKILVEGKGVETVEHYNIKNDGEWKVISLPFETKYKIECYTRIGGIEYTKIANLELSPVFADSKAPFLIPTMVVPFSDTSLTTAKAQELAADCDSDMEVVSKVLSHFEEGYKYDEKKLFLLDYVYAWTNAYLPDDTYVTKVGVCGDFAAMAAAMIRSQGIPCQIVYGYKGEDYHAWIKVYIEGAWVAYDPSNVIVGNVSAKAPSPEYIEKTIQ